MPPRTRGGSGTCSAFANRLYGSRRGSGPLLGRPVGGSPPGRASPVPALGGNKSGQDSVESHHVTGEAGDGLFVEIATLFRMSLTKEAKQEIVDRHGRDGADTGSAPV